MRIPIPSTPKTKFTRMCIGEAIVSLLKDQTLKQLKILDVVRKAGVSRMTFYKYYASSQAALEDYLHIIIAEYIEAVSADNGFRDFLEYDHILFALQFFDRYRTFFLVLKKQGLYSLLIDSVNDFVLKYIQFSDDMSAYKLYSYAGSLLNCFLMWEENDKKDPSEAVAQTIYQLYRPSDPS